MGSDARGGLVAGAPGAGEGQARDPAGAQQQAQRTGQLSRAGAAGHRVAQAGHGRSADHVQVHMHVQRAIGQVAGGQAGDLAAADPRAGQVVLLGRIQVAAPASTIRSSGTGRRPRRVAISWGW